MALDPMPDWQSRVLAGELQNHVHRAEELFGLRFGDAGLDEAWEEFGVFERDEPFHPESPYAQLFASWLLYDWLPDPHGTALPRHVQECTAAQAYLARRGARLDPAARRYIEACCAAPFSFYEVIECRPGRGFRLRDVLLGAEMEVVEHSGSASTTQGDILFAKVVPAEGLHLIEGMGPVALPPIFKPDLIDLRKKLGTHGSLFGADRLHEFDIELRESYLHIADSRLNPKLPKMQNTNGDPLEMHTLLFDLDVPSAAYEALKDLAVGASPEELEAVARRDTDGRLVSGEIPWRRAGNRKHKEWTNTSLGTLRIEGGRLTAEVNSAKRAATLRRLIEQRLGDTAQSKPSVVQSVQSMLNRSLSPEERADRERREAEQAELAARPEVQQMIREHLRNHYRAWIDEKIPALGNRTPRKAVRSADGREAVEALITQIERDGVRMSPPLDLDIVRELRETLGLSKHS